MKTTAIQNEMLTRHRDILSELLQPIDKQLKQLEATVANQAKKAADCRCADQAEKITQLEATVKRLKSDILSELVKPIKQRLERVEATTAAQAGKLTQLETAAKILKSNMDTMQTQMTSIVTHSKGLRSFTDELSTMRTELQAVSASSSSIERSLKQLHTKSSKS